ncbi:nuclear transport factor 2 family protein [Lacinutrix neustonica]|uniref:Nuclear transport factor 2 family protein n=1 Tax=Lacinutrix neustonica TaxID=2980107 RepID=A0A9E8SD08_9FLAO|nr:nuclear transport factor 2 family protein [Lacinutrix neustonica]WAC01187.1 nuclear transport factor 2 family protein [Lacinutrix neustonica]
MRFLKLFIFSILITACKAEIKVENQTSLEDLKAETNRVLDQWHKAAAEANFDNYFSLMTSDGVFIGTDASENWKNEAFRAFSKPYFDKGKAWSFTAIDRNIYIDNDKTTAWFDEILETQMKLCRGSGVLKLENNQWKIAHYVLSITIPNEKVSEIVKIKAPLDSLYAKTLQSNNKMNGF